MDKKPSYLGVFLRHPTNRMAMLAAAVVAIFASIPLGWSGLALVGVVTLGAEVLAALAIPGLPAFRAWADTTQHRQLRAERRIELLAEISNYGDTHALATYQHMFARVQALYQTAGDSRTTLERADVEKLEDLTVDYLGLCAVNLSLKQRKRDASEEIALKGITSIQAQLQNKTLPQETQRQLHSALLEYTEVVQRARRLAARRSALEATLVAMPDKMEEVYQLVITAPYSSDIGNQLEASLSRLRIAEEVAGEFETPKTFDFTAPMPAGLSNPTVGAAARQAARAVKT